MSTETEEVSLDDDQSSRNPAVVGPEDNEVEMSPMQDQIPRESQLEAAGLGTGQLELELEHSPSDDEPAGSDRPVSSRPYSISVTPAAPKHARAKGAQQMSILGYGGDLGLSDITIPRIMAFIFFGGGEIWAIPILWAILVLTIFVAILCIPNKIDLTDYVGMVVYRLSALVHTLASLSFGYCLVRDHVLDFYLMRCVREGEKVNDMMSRLDFFVFSGFICATALLILHVTVYSSSADHYIAFEFFQSLMLFYPSFFVSSIWTFIVFNKYRSGRTYLIKQCNADNIGSGKTWATIIDTLRDMTVVSAYWRKSTYARLLSGLIYSSFVLFQFYSVYATTHSVDSGEYYAFNSLKIDPKSETSAVFALFLGVEFVIFYGSIWVPMLITGWVNDKLIAHVLEAVALPLDYDLMTGQRNKYLGHAEARRHQLISQLDVYKAVVGYTFGVGTVTTNLAATWGIVLLIVMYMYAVVHNII
tara:strand:+ start:495 stop:1916 length:1422 start_codon:yes stop_codon:yes gene_type:complete